MISVSQLRFSSFRAAALSGVALAALNPLAAIAQDAAEGEVEQILVTGSRIARPELTSNSPISVVDQAELQFTGTINTEQLLNELPQIVPGITGQTNNPGSGQASVNLRNLGANRTLVLIDGMRLIPFTNGGSSVDLNTIPASLIERIEVVTGGASAVYGSDAVSGVVNFILRDDFEGVRIDSQYDISDETDAQIFNLNVTLGANTGDGRGNVTFHAAYTDRDEALLGDRDFTNTILQENTDANGNPVLLPTGGSSGVENTRLFAPSNFSFDENGDPFPDTSLYNYAPPNFLQLPQERWNIYGSGRYAITEHVEAYANGIFTQQRSSDRLAPTPLNRGVGGQPALNIDLFNNPFVTPAARDLFLGVDNNQDGVPDLDPDGDGIAALSLRRRLTEVGPRQRLTQADTFRIQGGFRGDFGFLDGDTFFSDWKWDAVYQFSRLIRNQIQNGNVSQPLVQQAATAVVDPATGQIVCADQSQGCAPLNMFGPGTISPEAADFIEVSVSQILERDQTVGLFTLAGDLPMTIPLADAPVALAMGAEYREEQSSSFPSELLAQSLIQGFNGAPPLSGNFNVWELFGELRVPIVEGKPFAEVFAVEAKGRYSDYSTIGGATTYAFSGEYAPVEDIRFRTNYQRAIRAPNIGELFATQSEGFPAATDPCAFTFAADGSVINDPVANGLREICVATGVPAALLDNQSFTAPDSQVRTLSGGNPLLQEETSDTLTFGAVIQPRWIDGLTIQLDYYNIEIEDAIAGFGGSTSNVLTQCYQPGSTLANPFCGVVERGSTGRVDQVVTLNQNISTLATEGVDVNIEYTFDPANWFSSWKYGSFDFDLLGTYLIALEQQVDPTAPLQDCAGLFGPTCGAGGIASSFTDPVAEWNHTATLRWIFGPVTTQLRWQYIGAMDVEVLDPAFNGGTGADPSTIAAPTHDRFNYLDVSAIWQTTEYLTVRGGVRNVADKEPPLTGDAFNEQANTFPGTYDTIGRTFFFGATLNF